MIKEIEFIDLIEEKALKPYQKSLKKILKQIKKELSIKQKLGLSITLCDNNYIQELNKTYREKDMPTDVLSFAIEDGENKELLEKIGKMSKVREIGDIIISYDKAETQAKEYGHSLNREICFLFTHGVLHLLGYDHMNDEDEKIMFDLQNKILSDLKINR